MKILAVVGSLRNGNSNFLVDEAIREIRDIENVQVTKVHLKDIEMRFCDGCLVCDDTGECVYSDDMSRLISQVRETDAFIFATPARWGLLSGEMKTFLDRLNPLAVNEELKNKRAIIIAVGQSEAEECQSIKLAAKSLEIFCNDAGISVVDSVIVCGCYEMTAAQSKPEYISTCKSAAIRLIGKG